MDKITIAPDLQTRAAVMVAAGRAQFAVTVDGDTRYVKIECKLKTDNGYKPAPLDLASHVFISEKGYGTTRIASYYPPKPGYNTGRLFTNNVHPDHIEAVCDVIAYVNGETVAVDIEVESSCGLCGRKLTDPESIKRGIGPECANKPTGTKILHASVFAPQAAPVQQQLPVAVPAPVSHDDNNADRARVECDTDVQEMTDLQLKILEAAVKEEMAIRAARRNPVMSIRRV